MPLAQSERPVAVVTQHLGHRGCGRRDDAATVRVATIDVRNEPHADRVMVAAGEQAGPSG